MNAIASTRTRSSETGPAGPTDTARASSPWMVAAFMAAAVAVALGFLLVAVLVNTAVHDLAYAAVRSMSQLFGDQVLARVIEHSPTERVRRAVDREAARFEESNRRVVQAHRDLQAKLELSHREQLRLQSEGDALRRAIVDLDAKHTRLQALTSKRAAAVRDVVTAVNTRLAARTTEGLATLPTRALPYVGVTALLVFTAAEIKADCDVAQSLAALSEEHGNAGIDTGAVCNAVGKVPSADRIKDEVVKRSSDWTPRLCKAVGLEWLCR